MLVGSLGSIRVIGGVSSLTGVCPTRGCKDWDNGIKWTHVECEQSLGWGLGGNSHGGPRNGLLTGETVLLRRSGELPRRGVFSGLLSARQSQARGQSRQLPTVIPGPAVSAFLPHMCTTLSA